MYLLLLYLPLLNSLILSILGFKLNIKQIKYITILNMGLTLLISYLIFYEVVLYKTTCYLKISSWIDSHIIEISWGFLFDTLTASMLIVINSISLCVHFYSMSYMNEDPHLKRFLAELSLFTFFMIILVSADNFLQMFLGW